MSEENLRVEIKNVSPYLPYGLKIQHITTKEIKIVNGIYEQYKDGTFIYYWNENYGTINASSHYKLVLRPMSNLTKKIEIDGVDIIPIEGMFLPCGERETLTSWADENKCWLGTQVSYLVYENLFELHFDVFGLIDKGLAVDINTLKSA